jgi:hypothetical protein
MDDLVKRIYERVNAAKRDGRDHIELDTLDVQELKWIAPPAPKPPEDWPEWAKTWRFVPPPGMDGEVFGFPFRVVEGVGP